MIRHALLTLITASLAFACLSYGLYALNTSTPFIQKTLLQWPQAKGVLQTMNATGQQLSQTGQQGTAMLNLELKAHDPKTYTTHMQALKTIESTLRQKQAEKQKLEASISSLSQQRETLDARLHPSWAALKNQFKPATRLWSKTPLMH
jgi:chromosome segregation ATPase